MVLLNLWSLIVWLAARMFLKQAQKIISYIKTQVAIIKSAERILNSSWFDSIAYLRMACNSDFTVVNRRITKKVVKNSSTTLP